MVIQFGVMHFVLSALFSILLLPVPPTLAHDGTLPAESYKGRPIAPTMSFRGADWLERADREKTEQPEKVLDALGIAPGSTVADIGAGTGYFTLRLARRVGPQGRVLATDIQAGMLARLAKNMRVTDLKNIELILCTQTDAKLPKDTVDLALMVDVYHELAYPAETLRQIRQALKVHGRLVLVEYRGEDPNVPIKPDHKMKLKQITTEIEPEGFRLAQVFDFLPHQHIVVFEKDDRKDISPKAATSAAQ